MEREREREREREGKAYNCKYSRVLVKNETVRPQSVFFNFTSKTATFLDPPHKQEK
jgi:hypothetical protein